MKETVVYFHVGIDELKNPAIEERNVNGWYFSGTCHLRKKSSQASDLARVADFVKPRNRLVKAKLSSDDLTDRSLS